MKKNEFPTTGKLLCLQYKYGNKNNILTTYENAFELVQKYPIVFTVIPEQFKDKKMVETFLDSNAVFEKKYWARVKAREKKMAEERKNNIYSVNHDNDNDIKNNAVIDIKVDLGKMTKDPEILVKTAEIEFGLNFVINKSNYDENSFKKAIKIKPMLIRRVYKYWEEEFLYDEKAKELIKQKYELFNNPDVEELAFFKCLSLIDNDDDASLLNLWIAYNFEEHDFKCLDDSIETMKRTFSKLSKQQQNKLILIFHYNAKYADKDKIDENIKKIIVKDCPIAGDILSDEDVLKYNLKQHLTEDETYAVCNNCYLCQVPFIKIGY